MPIAQECRRHVVSTAKFYRLKQKYGRRSGPADGPWGSECYPYAPVVRYHAGQRRAERLAGKGLTTLTKWRDAAVRVKRKHEISQYRACRLFGVEPKTVRRDPQGNERDCREAASVRLSPDRCHAGAQGYDHESQETVSHLSRGRTGREAATGAQAGPRFLHANASSRSNQCTLVAGFPDRHVRGLTQVLHSGRNR